MHPTPGAIRIASGWLYFGLLAAISAVITAADWSGVDWFRNQPYWLAFICMGGLAYLVWAYVDGKVGSLPPPPPQAGVGGRGGNATVRGSGIAIGGPGGSGGKFGRGGDGGSAHIEGDGIAAGGEGGAAGDDGIWRPPARSGYVIVQRALGLPIDPFLAQFGRGGAVPGWEERKAIVDQLRQGYLAEHPGEPDKIAVVPLDWINRQLESQGRDWRARVVEDQYEFYRSGRGGCSREKH